MQNKITFCGTSGHEYDFIQTPADSNWVHHAGVAVFAARDAYGWRVIKIAELSGRDHDVRPIWAFHDAQRFGADTVFISEKVPANVRRDMIDDMEAGLDPVMSSGSQLMAMAA